MCVCGSRLFHDLIRGAVVSQKRGGFSDEKTSFNGHLILLVHIPSFQKLDASVWATLGIMVKNRSFSRKVGLIVKKLRNQ